MLHERITDAERRLPPAEVAARVALGEVRGQVAAINRLRRASPLAAWLLRREIAAMEAWLTSMLDELDRRLRRRGR